MLKIALIGCGRMARQGHGPALQKYKRDREDVCLSACCDIDEESAKSFCEEFGFETYYTDYKQMIDEIRPHAVALICPVHLTCELASEIMKRGCHIIMEKPPGKNTDEIRHLLAVAKESGVSVRTAFNRRYTPLITELKRRILQCGEPIINITYQMYRYRRLEDDFSTTAIHAVDVVKFLADSRYSDVSLRYFRHPTLGENIKSIFLDASLESGAVAQISMVPIGGAIVERVTVNTRDHTFFAELPVWNNSDVPGRLTHVFKKKNTETVTGDQLSDSTKLFELMGFYDENRDFFDAVKNGAAPFCDLESAIQSVEIEDCIRHSLPFYKS